MFTGIITDVGKVRAVESGGDTRLEISTSYDADSIDIGASIACSGVCLTVVSKGKDGDGSWFCVDVSAETLQCTSLSTWAIGTEINLERSLRVGDELGGHIVSGHVDDTAKVVNLEDEGDSTRVVFECSKDLLKFVAPKGSVTIEGVSLTVNEVDDNTFDVNLIPHTKSMTTLGGLSTGQPVNMEIDILARYVARLNE